MGILINSKEVLLFINMKGDMSCQKLAVLKSNVLKFNISFSFFLKKEEYAVLKKLNK